ncbi:MAG: tRNA 2-selenouridine(34) synthase MnmH [Phycisphaerales bacterium]|nr:tRNA 2-selenouridine(34) synthase MnmH [Phycisphaerales bacterium]
MIQKISITDWATKYADLPVLDVRSPGEYKHAHIPKAISLPLFTDEERKIVGTAYKQESRQIAIKLGLDFFGIKMRKMVDEVEGFSLFKKNGEQPKKILIHCWRGGMRSAAVAWLFDLYGYKVYTLVGGYKAYRNFILDQFTKTYPFKIIGGYTGCGKTKLLHALKKNGHSVIDLEALACHKGSAFGNIGMPEQPTQEMFENLLATDLIQSSNAETIWIENESQRIGNVNIPTILSKQIQTKQVFFFDIPFEERLKQVLAEYGKADKEKLLNAIMRIKKRLGGLEAKNAINFLLEDNVPSCFEVLLKYYDKWYKKCSAEKPSSLILPIEAATTEPDKNLVLLLSTSNDLINSQS